MSSFKTMGGTVRWVLHSPGTATQDFLWDSTAVVLPQDILLSTSPYFPTCHSLCFGDVLGCIMGNLVAVETVPFPPCFHHSSDNLWGHDCCLFSVFFGGGGGGWWAGCQFCLLGFSNGSQVSRRDYGLVQECFEHKRRKQGCEAFIVFNIVGILSLCLKHEWNINIYLCHWESYGPIKHCKQGSFITFWFGLFTSLWFHKHTSVIYGIWGYNQWIFLDIEKSLK